MKIPIRQACKWIDPILIANAMVNEWGEEGPPEPTPNSQHDIIAEDFPDLLVKIEKFV